MRTPKNFEYDLWTTNENGIVRNWVRVKFTGEISEVSIEVMRLLRREEKALKRQMEKAGSEDETTKVALSLELLIEDEMRDTWSSDTTDMVEEIITNELEREFIKTLTDFEKVTYFACIRNGMKVKDFSQKHNVSKQYISKVIKKIREKANYFWNLG